MVELWEQDNPLLNMHSWREDHASLVGVRFINLQTHKYIPLLILGGGVKDAAPVELDVHVHRAL